MPVMLFRGIHRHSGTLSDCNMSGVGTLQRPVEGRFEIQPKKEKKKLQRTQIKIYFLLLSMSQSLNGVTQHFL